jgi:hypothetical protein
LVMSSGLGGMLATNLDVSLPPSQPPPRPTYKTTQGIGGLCDEFGVGVWVSAGSYKAARHRPVTSLVEAEDGASS